MPCISVDRLGSPCGRVEVVDGTQYCKIHFGQRQGLTKDGILTGMPTETKADIPMSSQLRGFYANKLSPKLTAMLTESAAHGALNNLRCEIELLRAENVRVAQLYDVLLNLQESDEAAAAAGGGIDVEQILNGRKLLRTQLDNAARAMKEALVENAIAEERYANVLSKTVDRMPPDAMQELVKQIIAAAHICFGRDFEGLQRFDKMLSEKLNLPSVVGSMGTHITPHNAPITPTQEVTAMVNTVPRWVETNE